MPSFTRLLVATEFPPNASGGGPAVVRQMLLNYPTDKLYWWSVRPDHDQKFGRSVAEHRVAHLPEKLYPYRRLPVLKSLILENLWSPWAARHLRQTLADLKPEAIWVIPHDWSIPPLASTMLDVKQSYHVTMQDYVDVHRHPEQFGPDRCRRMAAQADQLYSGALTRDATSHPMIDDLQKRTGVSAAQMLHAGLEPGDFEWLEKQQFASQNEIKIAHAGSILVPEAFQLFIRALASIRKDLPYPCTLELFGAHALAAQPWFDSSWMRDRGNLNEVELKQAMRQCQWGFVPMSLKDEDPRYNRFSFPTKYISCLMTGLPIIALGHETASVVKMAREYNTGFCSGITNEQELAEGLRTVLSNDNPREKYRAALLNCARKEFDASRMRETLMRCFERVASKNG
jgi:glycosyltransferase involved in cell wall biosynthesis